MSRRDPVSTPTVVTPYIWGIYYSPDAQSWVPCVPSWACTPKIMFRLTHRPTPEEHSSSVLTFLVLRVLLFDVIPGLVLHREFYDESNPSSFSNGSTEKSMQYRENPFDSPDLHDPSHQTAIMCRQTVRHSTEAHAVIPAHYPSSPNSIRSLAKRQLVKTLDPEGDASCGPSGYSDIHGKLSSTTFGRAGRHTGSGRYKNRIVRKSVRHVFPSSQPLVYLFYSPWF